jgi:hypothetical protein
MTSASMSLTREPPAGMVGAMLAIGGSKFSQIQEEKHEKAWSFIGGWNGHLRRGASWPSRGV